MISVSFYFLINSFQADKNANVHKLCERLHFCLPENCLLENEMKMKYFLVLPVVWITIPASNGKTKKWIFLGIYFLQSYSILEAYQLENLSVQVTKQRALDNIEDGNAPDDNDKDILFEGYVKVCLNMSVVEGIRNKFISNKFIISSRHPSGIQTFVTNWSVPPLVLFKTSNFGWLTLKFF